MSFQPPSTTTANHPPRPQAQSHFRQPRQLHDLPLFSASWLRTTKQCVEPKAKAQASPPTLQRTSSSPGTQLKHLVRTEEMDQSILNDVGVNALAQEVLNNRAQRQKGKQQKRRKQANSGYGPANGSNSWKYAFEKCYDFYLYEKEAERQDAEKERLRLEKKPEQFFLGPAPPPSSSSQSSTPSFFSPSPSSNSPNYHHRTPFSPSPDPSSDEFKNIKKYNNELASYIMNLNDAASFQLSLQLHNSTKNGILKGNNNSHLQTQLIQQHFRDEAYKRVCARIKFFKKAVCFDDICEDENYVNFGEDYTLESSQSQDQERRMVGDGKEGKGSHDEKDDADSSDTDLCEYDSDSDDENTKDPLDEIITAPTNAPASATATKPYRRFYSKRTTQLPKAKNLLDEDDSEPIADAALNTSYHLSFNSSNSQTNYSLTNSWHSPNPLPQLPTSGTPDTVSSANRGNDGFRRKDSTEAGKHDSLATPPIAKVAYNEGLGYRKKRKGYRVNDPTSVKIVCSGSIFRRLKHAIRKNYPDYFPSRNATLPTGMQAQALLQDDHYLSDMKLLDNNNWKAAQELKEIWGVGIKTAIVFVGWRVTSVAGLRADHEVIKRMNRQQVIGLKHYEDIKRKIPRDEVTAIVEYVTKVVRNLVGDKVSVTACGSYRRGKLTSGDCDLLLIPTSTGTETSATEIFKTVLRSLKGCNFLTDDLTMPNEFGENHPITGTSTQSYMGVCKVREYFRRIDMKAYPRSQGGFALLYFTGDAYFNRSMRSFCKRAKLTLSDQGLAACDREKDKSGKGLVRVKTYASCECWSEEECFEILGIGYVPPRYRDTVRAGC